MQQAVAIPVGVLAALSVAMFVFMFWWFPRHWQKGVRADMAEYDAARRERELAAANNPSELEAQAEGVTVETKAAPMPPRGYVPPVTPY